MKMARVWAITLALATVAAPVFAQGQGQGGRGRGGFGFGGGRGGFGGGNTSLLQIAEVQKELKLDQTQIELVQQLNKEMDDKRGAMFQGFRDLTDEQRREKFTALRPQMEKLQQDQEKKVAEILDAKQVARLKQLGIQRAGTQALGRDEVQAELKFTADQKAKFQAAQMEVGNSFRTAFEGLRDLPEDQRRAKFEEIRKANDAKLLAVLTDAQKKQFEGMKGAAFTFPPSQFGRGNRPRNNNN